MPTIYTNGLKLPDLGSIDWFNAYKNNIDILDPIVGTVNGVATTYAPISHNHDASEITSGTIDIARLPPAALERLHTVADQTARYALTTSTVQEGDTVKQLDTGVMYLVVDTSKLNSADGYTEYSAGTATKAIADADGNTISSTYGKLAGSQTWSELNTYSIGQVKIQSLTQEVGVTPQTSTIQYLEFVDKNNVQHGLVGLWDYDNGASEIQLNIRDTFSNGSKDPNGTSDTAFFSFGFQPTGVKFVTFSGQLNNSVIPLTSNTYTLGISSYRWSAVYADSYYYGTTAWGLDKANVWSGNNTFTASTIALKNTVLEQGVAPTSGNSNNLTFVDKNNNTLCYLRNRVNTDGETYIHLYAQNKFTNGALDPNGTLVASQFYVGITKTGDPYVVTRANTYPDINNAFSLGTSSYQWSAVYAQTYYYNGTAWGLDQANTWTGSNTFKSQNTNLALQSTVSELGSLTAASNWFRWIDKNGAQNAYISRDVWSDGADSLRIAIVGKRASGAPSTSGTEIDCGVRLNLEADGTKSVTPFDNNINLGTSTNKWKTLNGVNPGALSLPNSPGGSGTVNVNYIDISGDIITRNGSSANFYTAVCDGWISINSFATWLQISDDTTLMATTVTPGSDGFAQAFLPVRQGDFLRIVIIQTNTQFQSFKLIPCQGNV